MDAQPPVMRFLETIVRGDGDAMSIEAAHSLRWAEHRRRAYRPEAFDASADHLSLEWTGWADNICNDEPIGIG